MNEDGQYVFQPDAWEYVEDPSASEEDREYSGDFSIQVSFTRFKEIYKKDKITGAFARYFCNSTQYVCGCFNQKPWVWANVAAIQYAGGKSAGYYRDCRFVCAAFCVDVSDKKKGEV